MTTLVLAIVFTLCVSACCSLMEAFILSIGVAEIEGFTKEHPKIGTALERFKHEIDETTSAILTLNTIANTAGATMVGAIARDVLQSNMLALVSVGMVLGILFFSEIIPKNLGVAYRRLLMPYLTPMLQIVRLVMKPFSFFARQMLTKFVSRELPSEEDQEEEIRLLAERSAKAGALSQNELELISNTLSLDDISVESIMTPRTVVTFLQKDLTVDEICRDFRNIPFARMPIYDDSIDDINGVVRRRDILMAFGDKHGNQTMEELRGDALYVPETASGLQALQLFMKSHQQLGVVVDEYGSTAGVITMEDIIEHLIGDEIYEDSDIAVDMRELAKKRAERMPPATSDYSEMLRYRNET